MRLKKFVLETPIYAVITGTIIWGGAFAWRNYGYQWLDPEVTFGLRPEAVILFYLVAALSVIGSAVLAIRFVREMADAIRQWRRR